MKRKVRTKKRVVTAAALLMLAAGAVWGVNDTEVQAATKTVKINKKNFPDQVFRELVKANYDKNKDKKLSAAEIKKAKKFGSGGKTSVKIKPSKYAEYEKKYISDIKNFKGIEKLTNLQVLAANETSVKKINLKKNKNLVTLRMEKGKLKSLDLNKNTKLKYVYLSYNPLTSLKINKCKKLLLVELRGHMVKNLKINRNKKTEVIGGKYYTPYEVTEAPLSSQNGSPELMMDVNGNYCVYQWAEDLSSCTKYTWNGTKMEESRIAMDAAVVSKAKSMHDITGQWQDGSGNFYFIADQNGDMAGESVIYICKVNAQGNMEKETLLAGQLAPKSKQYMVEYLNQKDSTVLLKITDGDGSQMYRYGVITFDMNEMCVKSQANTAYDIVAAEGDVAVGIDGSTVIVYRLSGSKEVTLENGYQLQAADLSSNHELYISVSDNFASAVTVRNGCIYAISGNGMFKATLSATSFKQIYGVGKMRGLQNFETQQNSLMVRNDKEICLMTSTYDYEKETIGDYVLQIGKVK